jgi:rhodanese-related sulfurtransferase
LYFTDTATGNPYSVPFFLDVRDDESYLNGHLCGTAHVYWKDVFKKENLARLPLDRPILVYGTTGHESGQIAALLNLLGYDAINLKWGISGWSLSLPGKEIAPERFERERDCMNYDLVTGYASFLPCPT